MRDLLLFFRWSSLWTTGTTGLPPYEESQLPFDLGMGRWHGAIGKPGLGGPAPARESAGEVSWDA
jgi:hypothetical protein